MIQPPPANPTNWMMIDKMILCARKIRMQSVLELARRWKWPKKCSPWFLVSEKWNRQSNKDSWSSSFRGVVFEWITLFGVSVVGSSSVSNTDEHIIHSRMTFPNIAWFTSQWQNTRNLCKTEKWWTTTFFWPEQIRYYLPVCTWQYEECTFLRKWFRLRIYTNFRYSTWPCTHSRFIEFV